MKKILSAALSIVFLFNIFGNVVYATNIDGDEFLTQEEMIENSTWM